MTQHPEQQYLDLLKEIMENGSDRANRTGVDTRVVHGKTMRFDMADGFPAITTKKLYFKGIKGELLWMIEGSSDDNRLKEILETNTTFWTANASADYWKSKANFEGDLGRIYGVQWRMWQTPDNKEIDQLQNVIDGIIHNPTDRRLIVVAYNPGELDQMALPPCHMFFQFFPRPEDNKLDLLMYQRSCDMFLGVPFNIASYSLLLHMVSHVTNFMPGEFIHILGNTHIYHNHFEQVKIQLERKPLTLPKLFLSPDIKNINDFTMDDIKLVSYNSHPAISAKMAV